MSQSTTTATIAKVTGRPSVQLVDVHGDPVRDCERHTPVCDREPCPADSWPAWTDLVVVKLGRRDFEHRIGGVKFGDAYTATMVRADDAPDDPDADGFDGPGPIEPPADHGALTCPGCGGQSFRNEGGRDRCLGCGRSCSVLDLVDACALPAAPGGSPGADLLAPVPESEAAALVADVYLCQSVRPVSGGSPEADPGRLDGDVREFNDWVASLGADRDDESDPMSFPVGRPMPPMPSRLSPEGLAGVGRIAIS